MPRVLGRSMCGELGNSKEAGVAGTRAGEAAKQVRLGRSTDVRKAARDSTDQSIH